MESSVSQPQRSPCFDPALYIFRIMTTNNHPEAIESEVEQDTGLNAVEASMNSTSQSSQISDLVPPPPVPTPEISSTQFQISGNNNRNLEGGNSNEGSSVNIQVPNMEENKEDEKEQPKKPVKNEGTCRANLYAT